MIKYMQDYRDDLTQWIEGQGYRLRDGEEAREVFETVVLALCESERYRLEGEDGYDPELADVYNETFNRLAEPVFAYID